MNKRVIAYLAFMACSFVFVVLFPQKAIQCIAQLGTVAVQQIEGSDEEHHAENQTDYQNDRSPERRNREQDGSQGEDDRQSINDQNSLAVRKT